MIGMGVYGKEFAAVYNDQWRDFTTRLWPFLSKTVTKHNREANTWLDLCCGTGFLLRLVCDSGFQAVGLDISPHVLTYASKNAPTARLVKADVRDFSLPRRFDVITCMYDSLNYLRLKKDLERVFRRVHRHLASSGLFIFDVNTFEGLQDNWCRTSTIRDSHRTIIIDTSFDSSHAVGRCLITGFVKHGRVYRKFEEEHIQRGYRATEVEDLLTRTGFTWKKFDGSTLARPRKRSGRLIYVCGSA